MRLAVVTNILAPYRIPLFSALASRCDDFLVLLLADRHVNRDWFAPPVGFATRTLPGIRISNAAGVDPVHLNVGAWAALSTFRPDVVLGGGFTPAHLAAMLYCRYHGKEYVPWGELTLAHQSEELALRRWLRRWMIGSSRRFIASSTATRAAFVHHGADPGNVLVSPMPVGNAVFRALAASARASGDCARIRLRHGTPLIVSAGRLVDSKGWIHLLRAFQIVSREFPSAELVIAGEGPRREHYLVLADSLRIRSRVRFAGQLTANQLASLYAAADVFTLATLADPYGAVLPEAMACDTVVVSSVHAAATADMVVDGESGFIADPLDEQAFADALTRALSLSPERRATLLAQARLRTPDDDMEYSASAIVDFLSARITGHRHSTSALVGSAATMGCHRDAT
ncbi:MAG TPA: glycosyltransferase [Steroidobacteraceae bacterium]|nr:glycosyltransferase [Steroidobacteraceae bacterium]